MNQQCKVCGEPAAGFHFGAFTCEGCKVNPHELTDFIYYFKAPHSSSLRYLVTPLKYKANYENKQILK